MNNVVSSANLKKKDYVINQDEKGVVLLDVNWSRKWACGQFENAQLVSLNFEKIDVVSKNHNKYSTIRIKTSSKLFAKRRFINYGFLIEPGEYAFSGWSLKAAKSESDIGYFKAEKSDLIDESNLLGGSFNVNKGEIVFIGNFFLDCYEKNPIPWRYYPTNKAGFELQKAEYRKKYKFLKNRDIQFRLLKTEHFGLNFESPNY